MPSKSATAATAAVTATLIEEVRDTSTVEGKKQQKKSPNREVTNSSDSVTDSSDDVIDPKKPKEQQRMKATPALLKFLEDMKTNGFLDNTDYKKTKETVNLTQYKNVNEDSKFTVGEIMTLISCCAKQQQGTAKDLIEEKLETEELKNSFTTLLKGKFFLIGPLKDFFLALITQYNSDNASNSKKKEYTFNEIDLDSEGVDEEIRTAIRDHFKNEWEEPKETKAKGGKNAKKSVQQTHKILLATQGDRMIYSHLALIHPIKTV